MLESFCVWWTFDVWFLFLFLSFLFFEWGSLKWWLEGLCVNCKGFLIEGFTSMSWVRKPLCFPSVSPKFPYLYFFSLVSKKRTSLIRLGCTYCLVLVAEKWSQTEVEILFTVCRLLFNFPVFRTTPFSPLLSACLQMVPSVPDTGLTHLAWRGRNGVGWGI